MNKKETMKEVPATELAEEMREGFKAMRDEMHQGFKAVREEMEIMDKKMATREEMYQGFELMDQKFDSFEENVSVKIRFEIDKLEDRTFSPDEKKSLLDTAKLINDRWAEEETGKNHITLTRGEYDAVSRVQGFPHRFVGASFEID